MKEIQMCRNITIFGFITVVCVGCLDSCYTPPQCVCEVNGNHDDKAAADSYSDVCDVNREHFCEIAVADNCVK